MARYINLDELLTAIDIRNGRLPLWLDEILMEDCKVTDVAPVRHGHWISNTHTDTAVCSECRGVFTDETNFCPNCGAKMDGE